jgi:guanine nucleotide-binding protein subunit beta-2-like 1 protein
LRKVNAEAVLDSSPFKGESEELNSIVISNSNKYFAVGGALGVVRVYDFSSGQFIHECKAHSSAILAVCFSPDDRQLISTGKDGLIAIWNLYLAA